MIDVVQRRELADSASRFWLEFVVVVDQVIFSRDASKLHYDTNAPNQVPGIGYRHQHFV